MANIIINKREGVTDEEALYYVSHVVRQGKISDNGNCYCYVTKFYDGIEELIEYAPVRHGLWIFDAGVDYCSKCSECKAVKPPHYIAHNYCPSCGALMDKEE